MASRSISDKVGCDIGVSAAHSYQWADTADCSIGTRHNPGHPLQQGLRSVPDSLATTPATAAATPAGGGAGGAVFFFFQAEDGIRDLTVTGVQTCALPI